jgi:hypothetical protein
MHLRRALRPSLLRHLLPLAPLSLVLHAAIGLAAFAQAPTSQDGPLQPSTDTPRVRLIGNDDILKMAHAGLGDDLILQTIQLKPGHYDTTPDDLIALKTAGLSDRVISAMVAHGTPAAHDADRPTLRPFAASNPADSARTPAGRQPATLPPGVDEIGVYYKLPAGKTPSSTTQPGLITHQAADANAQWTELLTERVVFKSGGAAKSILTHGIISKDMNGHVDGPRSTLVLPTGVELLIYAPLGTDAAEYDLIRFRDKKDAREFRTLTGGVFHSESGAARDEIEFHPVKIAPQLYTFTIPVDIEKGEYGVLPPGSANQRGFADTGKIFTFSISE